MGLYLGTINIFGKIARELEALTRRTDIFNKKYMYMYMTSYRKEKLQAYSHMYL